MKLITGVPARNTVIIRVTSSPRDGAVRFLGIQFSVSRVNAC